MTTQILTLPPDALRQVFSRLFFAERALCKMVCKLFCQMINEANFCYVPHARGESLVDHLRQNCPEFEKRLQSLMRKFMHQVASKNSGRFLISFAENKDQYLLLKFIRNKVEISTFDIDMRYEITFIKPQPINPLQLYPTNDHLITDKATTLRILSNLSTNSDEAKMQQLVSPLLQKQLHEKKLVKNLQLAYFLCKLLLLMTLMLPLHAKP